MLRNFENQKYWHMAYSCDEETLQRMGHNMSVIPSPPQTPQVTKPNKIFPFFLVTWIWNIHYVTKKKHSQDEGFQLQTTFLAIHIHGVLFHYHLLTTKYWKQIKYLNPLEPMFMKIIFKNSIPTIQNTSAILI